jgi:dihydrodipicolinate synthase/N-acetylneuraminate lyase
LLVVQISTHAKEEETIMPRELRGILSAMCTPFTPDGREVDEPALRELVDGTIKAGVHGLIPCGSTGEFPVLTTEERKRVAEVVVDQARGRVPVAPHVGSTSTAIAVDLARHAEHVGASMRSTVTSRTSRTRSISPSWSTIYPEPPE